MTTIIKKHEVFLKYILVSATVTIIDILVARTSENYTTEVIANTIGVIAGFIIQYFLCTRKVFANKGKRAFIIFLLTWLLGLLLADFTVYIVRVLLFHSKDEIIYFIIGKGASMAVPFFITYFIRKSLLLKKGQL